MRKPVVLAITFVTAVLCLCLAGCSSGGGNASAAAEPQFEAAPNSMGNNMISDGKYIYFTTGDEYLYRADLDMGSVIVLDYLKGGEINALFLGNGNVYYTVFSMGADADGKANKRCQIRCVDPQGRNAEILKYTQDEVFSIGMWQDMFVYVDDDSLSFFAPGSSTGYVFRVDGMEIVAAFPTEEGVYFTTREKMADGGKLYLFKGDVEKPDVTEIADIGNCGTIGFHGSDVYYLAKSDESSHAEAIYDLVKLDEQGNVTQTGISGHIGSLATCGNCLIYSKHEINDQHTWEWVSYCYNTETGSETLLDGCTDKTVLSKVSDVAEGYAYLCDTLVGPSGEDYVLNLLDSEDAVSIESIVEDADETLIPRREVDIRASARQGS